MSAFLTRTPFRPVVRLLGVVLFVAVLGCSGGSGPNTTVKGKVLMGGQPVNGGLIFVGVDNKEMPFPINPDGSYLAKGVPVGQAKVMVKGGPAAAGPVGGGPVIPKDMSKDMMSKGTVQGGVSPPPKYGTPAGAFTIDVKEGETTKDFELTP
jgi:hypothetical protein